MRKKISILFLILLSCVCLSLAAAKKLKLNLPVRILDKSPEIGELKKENFNLIVNGEKREILALLKGDRTLSSRADLKRNLILSFFITEYGKQIADAISYFVYQVLNPGDTLILVTSLKLYRFSATANKEKITKDIGELVKKDCFTYKNNRAASEKSMDKAVSRINYILKKEVDGDTGSVFATSTALEVTRFLDRITRESLNFKTRFLLPDTGKIEKINELLGTRGGERWWIHFQQQDVYPSLTNLRKAILNIREHLSSLEGSGEEARAKAAATKISLLERHLLLSDSFPIRELLDTTVGGNISYSVLFFRSSISSSKKSALATAPDLGGILKEVAKKSGGKSITTTNINQAMEEIKNHRDQYYELIYGFDGKFEEKQIKIELPGKKEKVSCKDRFTKEEIETLVQYLAKEKVKIETFSIKNNLLKFSIKSFKLQEEKGEKFGILKVRIELYDEKGSNVYRKENTLRAAKETLGLSIPIPSKYGGKFKLQITVFDLIANSSTFLIRDIKL